MKWKRSDVKVFETEIETEGRYDVYVLLRHASGFPYATVPVKLELDGAESGVSSDFRINVIDTTSKEYLGNGSGDLWDVDFLALPNQHIEKGPLRFKLSHASQTEELQLMMEVGVMVKMSEEP